MMSTQTFSCLRDRPTRRRRPGRCWRSSAEGDPPMLALLGRPRPWPIAAMRDQLVAQLGHRHGNHPPSGAETRPMLALIGQPQPWPIAAMPNHQWPSSGSKVPPSWMP